MKILLEEGADVTVRGEAHGNALYAALDKDNRRIAEMLVSAFHRSGLFHAFHNDPMIAKLMYQHALIRSEQILGSDYLSTLAVANDPGNALRTQKRLKEAESMLQRALSGREKILGPNHPLTLAAVNNIGLLYRD